MSRARVHAVVLIGLLVVSLGLYWAAEAGATVAEVAGLLIVVALAGIGVARR